MNDESTHAAGPGEPQLPESNPLGHPADVRSVATLLEELARIDRAAAPAFMESRVLSVVTAQTAVPRLTGAAEAKDTVDTARASDELLRLAQAERSGAPASLEERIFAATRPIIAYNAAKAHGLSRPHPVYGSLSFRAAAGLLIGGGLIWTYLSLRPIPNFGDKASANSVAALEARLDTQFDQLSYVFEVALNSSDSEKDTASSEASEIGEWPQYDLLVGGDS